ncbi:MAG: Trehalose utilization [Fibrobacteres bacterium]|nr:Trehalose utilization [Fibrobacterota bacterium]
MCKDKGSALLSKERAVRRKTSLGLKGAVMKGKKTMGTTLGRSILTVAFALGLGAMGKAEAQTLPLAKQRTVTVGAKSYLLKSRLKAILVGSFTYGFNHTDGYPNLEATLKRIGAAEGWTVDITNPTNKGSEVTAAKLAGYQVFFANYISYWAQSGQFPAAGKTAVQDFVETKGNGVFLMHSSGDSGPSQNWPWFYDVVHPVLYNGESSRTTVSAPVFIPAAEKAHPVMEGINFAGKDTVIFPQGEWHTFQHIITDVVPKADVFLKMNGAKCTKGGTGTNCGSGYNYSVPGGYPASWTFPDKKGTIGYFMEGHDQITMQAMTQAVWDKFFKQFMYYMAGYDSTEVPTGLSQKDGTEMGVDASGITFHSPDKAGVFISKPGYHVISLFDMAGHKLKEIRGSESPADFDLSPALQGAKSGVYAMRVTVGGASRTGRFLIH